MMMFQYLASKDRSCINKLNAAGESALHEACIHDQPQNVLQLLKWDFNPNVSESYRFPIHCAVEKSSIKYEFVRASLLRCSRGCDTGF